MGSEELQAFRRRRLAAAVDKAGDQAALGRLLGGKDGSLVGQLLRGKRSDGLPFPISEKMVAKIEDLPGFAGWFGNAPVPPQRNSRVDGSSTTPPQVAVWLSYLSDDERAEVLRELKERAARAIGLKKLDEGDDPTGIPDTGPIQPLHPQQEERRGDVGDRRGEDPGRPRKPERRTGRQRRQG